METCASRILGFCRLALQSSAPLPLHPAFRRGHRRCFLAGCGNRLFSLAFGDGARFRQARIGLLVERSELVKTLRAGPVPPRRSQGPLRPDSPGLLGIDPGLRRLQLVCCSCSSRRRSECAPTGPGLRCCRSARACLFLARPQYCSSPRTAIVAGLDVSPSRKRTSRILPLVFGAISESSPSIRPLTLPNDGVRSLWPRDHRSPDDIPQYHGSCQDEQHFHRVCGCEGR